MSTKIEWVKNPDGTQGETWNVSMGCTPKTEGCKNCFARTMIKRFAGKAGWPASVDEIKLFPERLEQPFRWKKPKRIFVNSMSDLFHESVPFQFITDVFGVMDASPRHTYMILTKRPDIMVEWLRWIQPKPTDRLPRLLNRVWPLPNVWLGVSVENQKTADERIPLLLKTPAAKRFVSCEPLLGPIRLNLATDCDLQCSEYQEAWCPGTSGKCICQADLDQIIVGAETGPGKRPMELDWARSIRDQCQEAGVSFFFKKDSDGNQKLDGKMWRG